MKTYRYSAGKMNVYSNAVIKDKCEASKII